ncbi:zinc finger protein 574-like [Denticeps clupeoides]|uniref:zinc finger protein 574-like n=1 Tax=Denticeps clupeoides TaxID=299321 RepID=UPI0010A55E5A|nr:zinc finger protein 574-like [Denticeps clupeoides]
MFQRPLKMANKQLAYLLSCSMASSEYSSFSPLHSIPVFCFACSAVFSDKASLETHLCPAASFICSCGMGFSNYTDMLSHRIRHETARMVGFLPQCNSIVHKKSDSQIAKTKENPGIQKQVAKTPSVVTSPVAPVKPASRMDSGGTTVSLSRRFRPAVVLKTKQRFCGDGRYVCARCLNVFSSQDSLIEHVATHATTGVYGCRHCGLLLLSYSPPSFHYQCRKDNAQDVNRFTEGRFVSSQPVAKKYPINKCPHCPASYYTEWHLRCHVQKQHASEKNLPSAVEKAQEISPNKGEQSKTVSCLKVEEAHRCVICNVTFTTIDKLGQHWCTKNLILIKQERAHSDASKRTKLFGGQERMHPYRKTARDTDKEVTVRLQTTHSVFRNAKSEACEVNSPVPSFTTTGVQTKVEWDDGSYDMADTHRNEK